MVASFFQAESRYIVSVCICKPSRRSRSIRGFGQIQLFDLGMDADLLLRTLVHLAHLTLQYPICCILIDPLREVLYYSVSSYYPYTNTQISKTKPLSQDWNQ